MNPAINLFDAIDNFDQARENRIQVLGDVHVAGISSSSYLDSIKMFLGDLMGVSGLSKVKEQLVKETQDKAFDHIDAGTKQIGDAETNYHLAVEMLEKHFDGAAKPCDVALAYESYRVAGLMTPVDQVLSFVGGGLNFLGLDGDSLFDKTEQNAEERKSAVRRTFPHLNG